MCQTNAGKNSMPPSPATPVWILCLTVTHALQLEFIDTLFKNRHELIYQNISSHQTKSPVISALYINEIGPWPKIHINHVPPLNVYFASIVIELILGSISDNCERYHTK